MPLSLQRIIRFKFHSINLFSSFHIYIVESFFGISPTLGLPNHSQDKLEILPGPIQDAIMMRIPWVQNWFYGYP